MAGVELLGDRLTTEFAGMRCGVSEVRAVPSRPPTGSRRQRPAILDQSSNNGRGWVTRKPHPVPGASGPRTPDGESATSAGSRLPPPSHFFPLASHHPSAGKHSHPAGAAGPTLHSTLRVPRRAGSQAGAAGDPPMPHDNRDVRRVGRTDSACSYSERCCGMPASSALTSASR